MRITNKSFSENKRFAKMCNHANIKATKRQASKFRMGKGYLYKKQSGWKGNINLPDKAKFSA